MKQMPEYKDAQKKIDQLAKKWEEEINRRRKEIQGMYDELKAEEVLLTDEMRQKRLKEIRKKEEELQEFQKKVFGFEGLYYLKKKEIMQPVQDKVFEAVEKVADAQQLQVVFDKANDNMVMIYTNPVHDYTDYVLDELGLGDQQDKVK